MTSETTHLTLASDEDGEQAFVLVDEAAPTAEAVAERFPAAAKEQWGIEYVENPGADDMRRRWYKPNPDDDESFVSCAADDPDRQDEWWTFTLSDEKRDRGWDVAR